MLLKDFCNLSTSLVKLLSFNWIILLQKGQVICEPTCLPLNETELLQLGQLTLNEWLLIISRIAFLFLTLNVIPVLDKFTPPIYTNYSIGEIMGGIEMKEETIYENTMSSDISMSKVIVTKDGVCVDIKKLDKSSL